MHKRLNASTDVRNNSLNQEAALEHSKGSTLKSTRLVHGKQNASGVSDRKLGNQSISSDCTEFYKTSMNRPAVTHKVKADRLMTVAKQMKQLRKKLIKHGSMQKVYMDTLAVL